MNILNTVIQIVYSDTLHNRACCSSHEKKLQCQHQHGYLTLHDNKSTKTWS